MGQSGGSSALIPVVVVRQAWSPVLEYGALKKLEGFCTVVKEVIIITNKDRNQFILARELMSWCCHVNQPRAH